MVLLGMTGLNRILRFRVGGYTIGVWGYTILEKDFGVYYGLYKYDKGLQI